MAVGDIVWVNLPYTNLREAKRRPVLVIADGRDHNEADWLVCEITSSLFVHRREIALSRRDLRAGRLLAGSKARPDRIFTVNESVFGQTFARLTDAKTAEIRAAVRELF